MKADFSSTLINQRISNFKSVLCTTSLIAVYCASGAAFAQQIVEPTSFNERNSNLDANNPNTPNTELSDESAANSLSSQSSSQSTQSTTEENAQFAKNFLEKMSYAAHNSNYELSYVLIRQSNIEPLVYRHAIKDGRSMAHSLYLSGHLREVIRLGDVVSYIEPSVQPFSVRSKKMVAPIIPMLDVDIEKLSSLYDFIPIGRAREAATACQVIRIVPKDGLRYSYVIWVDEHSKLPLRTDLIDRRGKVIEQYRAVSYVVSDDVMTAMLGIENAQLPEVLVLPESEELKTNWQVSWVPEGFKDKGVNRYRMPTTGQVVENRLYSDGLFNFSVYVADTQENINRTALYRQGRRVVHTFTKNNQTISVIGDIPAETAKRISNSIQFSKN